MSDTNEFLEHYGVKGMKWGIRKDGKRGSKRTKKENKARAKRRDASNRRRQLSGEDLKKYIERLNDEKKLKELVDQDLKPGRSVAKRIASESGQKVARTVISGAGIYAVKVAMDKKFDRRDAASYIAPRPKK